MKICIASANVFPHAGLGRAALSIADGLSARGHTVGILTSAGESPYEQCTISLRASLRRPIRLIRELLAMRRFLSTYDVVVAFDPRPVGILVHLACVGLKVCVIIHALGTYALFEPGHPLKNWLIKWAYARSKRVFVINEFVRRCIESSGKSFSFGANLAYVPLGVDTKLFAPVPNPSFRYGTKYLLSVGALKARKGQLMSVKAFTRIAGLFPDTHYVLVGDAPEGDPYIKEIRAVIQSAGMSDRIHLVQGASDQELIDLYSGALLFVLTPVTTPYAIEGFGMVYLEAALCGAPALGTWGTGAEAAIENGKSGLLVEGNESAITEGMRELLSDDGKRGAYARYARERALMMSWSNVIDVYERELVSCTI